MKEKEVKPRDLNNLLQSVKQLRIHQQEIEKIRGEKFNVFKILRMQTKEDRLHSRFIAELLNPKGSHLQGSAFLAAFLEVTKLKEEIFEITSPITVIREKHIGKIDKEKSEGGFIDIFIENSKGKSISIENKIYACDQENQIFRYYNYRKGQNTVLYLTLDGREPDEKSTNGLQSKIAQMDDAQSPDYYCISYREHIQEWLVRCIEIANNEPILRESLRQYLILIQQLTHTMNNQGKKELEQLFIHNFNEAKLIANEFPLVINKMIFHFKNDLVKLLRKSLVNFDVWQPKNTQDDIQIWDEKKSEKSVFKFCISNFNDTEPLTIKTVWRREKIDSERLTNHMKTKLVNIMGKFVTIFPVEIESNDRSKIYVGSEQFFKMIMDDSKREKVILEIVKQTNEYIRSQKEEIVDAAMSEYMKDQT